MAVPTWLSALGHFTSDVVGTMFGIQVAETRKKAAEVAGTELKRALMPDREDVMKEILYLGDEAKALHELLVEANELGFVVSEGKRRAESWIVNMLLKVDPRDRSWVFRMLNEALAEQGRKEFFTHLETLHNDGWLQYLRLAKIVAGEKMGKVKAKLPKLGDVVEQVDHWAANTAAPKVDKLLQRLEKLDRKERQAERKGVWR